VLKKTCARNAAARGRFASNWGYEGFETDCGSSRIAEIDLVDIATPTTPTRNRHRGGAGRKMVMCEKPLGRTTAESEAMVKSVKKPPSHMLYNYRRVPAVMLAKQLIDENRAWENLPLSQCLFAGIGRSPQICRKAAKALASGIAQVAGSGVTGDLLPTTIPLCG